MDVRRRRADDRATPTRPATEFKIAAAGPLVTLAIVAVCGAIGIALGGPGRVLATAMRSRPGADISAALAMLAWLATINLLVLVFNLIPAFPLDGGRIARAIAWRLTGNRNRATRFAATARAGLLLPASSAVGLLLVLAGDVISGIWLALIGFILGSVGARVVGAVRVLQPDRGHHASPT